MLSVKHGGIMRGICKLINSLGVPTHVRVQDVSGGVFVMTIEEYTDQGIQPPVSELPVCAEDKPNAKITDRP